MARPLKSQNQPRKSDTYSLKVINHETVKSIAKERNLSKSEALDALLDNIRTLRGE
jgi:hypothetical protein